LTTLGPKGVAVRTILTLAWRSASPELAATSPSASSCATAAVLARPCGLLLPAKTAPPRTRTSTPVPARPNRILFTIVSSRSPGVAGWNDVMNFRQTFIANRCRLGEARRPEGRQQPGGDQEPGRNREEPERDLAPARLAPQPRAELGV